MEEKSDICLTRERCLPEVRWDHQQIISMNPYLLHLRKFLLSKIIYFGSEPLVDLNIVLP